MKFELELKKGNFLVTKCTKCNIIIWPISKFCNQCFGETVWEKGPTIGKILEFSKENNSYFCLSDFDGIKLIGQIISGVPEEDKKVQIEKCGIRNKNYFFDLRVL